MKLVESNKKEFGIVFVSNPGSTVLYINDKNYNDIDSIYDEAYEKVSIDAGFKVGEIWIDDVIAEGFDIKGRIDWKKIITDRKGIIDPEIIEKAFEDDEFVVKAQFVTDLGMDIKNVDLDEIQVYDAKHENWVGGKYDHEYPENWITDYAETFYPDLVKQLEKANADSYMDWTGVISDNEINGELECARIDEYFVYVYGSL